MAALPAGQPVPLGAMTTMADGIAVGRPGDVPFALVRDVVAALSPRTGHVVLGAEPATLKGRRGGNVLVVAGPDASLGDALRRRAASYAAPYRVLTGRDVADAFGGGTPRHDA